VLLQPHEVRTSWREFMSSSNVAVQQALAAQQANKMAGSRPPPFWAILAILFLGWNEFMALLWNPVYLVLGLAAFLFGRTLYSELEVDAELSRGALPAALSIAGKLGPATRAVLHRTLESLQGVMTKLPEEVAQVKSYISDQELSASVSSQHNASAPGLKQRRGGGNAGYQGTPSATDQAPATPDDKPKAH